MVNIDIWGESVDMSGIYYDEQDMGNTEKVVQTENKLSDTDEGKSADEINRSNEVESNSIE